MPNRAAQLHLEAASPGAVLRHRGETGLSYLRPDGKVEHRYSVGPIHWRKPGDTDWREIDTDLESREGTFSLGVRSARFDTTVAPNGRRRFYPRRWVDEYVEFGVMEWETLTGWRTAALGTAAGASNRLEWDRTTHRAEVHISGTGSRLEVTLKRPTVARNLRWRVTPVGLDWKDGTLVSVSDGTVVGWIRRPSWIDSSPGAEWKPVPWDFDGTYLTVRPDFGGAVFPVHLDPDYGITAGADDCYAENSALVITGNNLYLGTSGGSYYKNASLRFDGIAADSGDTCDTATIEFTTRPYGSGTGSTVETRIWCIDEDDFATPGDYAAWNTDHGLHDTEAATDWDFSNTTTDGLPLVSADFADHVTHVLARGGWATGQALGVHVDNDGSTSNRTQNTHSYESSGTEATLSLTTSSGSSGAEVSPSPVGATAGVSSVTVKGGGKTSPGVIGATAGTNAPTVGGGATVSPSPVGAVAGVSSVTVKAGSSVSPSPVAATAGTNTPTVRGGASIGVSSVAATAGTNTPTVGGGAGVSPASVAATAGVGSVTVRGGASVSPGTVAATAGVNAPAVQTAARVSPSPVGAIAGTNTPAVSGDASVSPSPVAATAGVPGGNASASDTIEPPYWHRAGYWPR